ncbi:expressed unknown protein [Seminavis robusta]|uniref:Uncharacterized protein n=1 Tax=Seminavis robusta TaxID=568900 RepID=A0A9N8HPS3_9STRA|nr:expressed unknown protein [Seminavis robusta]|eukprot:Sro1359_g265920.1 n/a (188) ;mRNA; f:2947-3510
MDILVREALMIIESVLGNMLPTAAKVYTNSLVVWSYQTKLRRSRVLKGTRHQGVPSGGRSPFDGGLIHQHWQMRCCRKAQRQFQKGIAIQESLLGSSSPNIDLSYVSYGIVLTRRGDVDAAWHALQKALAMNEAQSGLQHPATSTTQHLATSAMSLSRKEIMNEQRHIINGLYQSTNPASARHIQAL